MTMRVFLTISAVLFAFVQSTPVLAQDAKRQIVIEKNSDYFGFDLETKKNLSLDRCKASCLESRACLAFTYNTSARFCFLKSDFGVLQSYPGAIAGRVVTAGAEPDIGAAPGLSFLSSYDLTQARKFRDILSRQKLAPGLGFAGLMNQARQKLTSGDSKTAVTNMMAALKIKPGDNATWLELSAAAAVYAQQIKGSRQKRTARQRATMAAVNSYLTSRTTRTRAAALAQIARAIEAQGRYRQALTAYKESLKLDDLPAERTAFMELRRTRGFRVLNHAVDSDNRSPRICVQFSENLKKPSAGYESFVTVDGTPVKAIDVKSKQICVEGLAHGRAFKIGLRQGLPSAIGEDLLADVALDIYIRDRKPAVRFTGSNFVLPSSARRGIPLVTVNADKADLKLYRIGERALAPLLRDTQFLRQLSAYEIDDLIGNLGEPNWNGSIAIKPELNREVVTSIPIDDALPQRKPGVYVLIAKPVVNDPGGTDARATQWFVISDIGLTTFSGAKNLTVTTRSLASARPLANVELTLIARNNEVLGTAKTDAGGQAKFDAGLTRGAGGLAPAIVAAKSLQNDFVFIDISKPGFDFSDRGVTGRAVPKGVDVYAWTERGIYRAGETVHVSALARDPSAHAIDDLPLTFVFQRPDGAEDRRIVDKGAALGGYAVKLPLTGNAKRGTWTVRVFTDPKKPAVAEQRFLVEDFLPERTDFTLTPAQDAIAIGQIGTVKVAGRYLYGAPAAGLPLEGELVVRSKRSRKGFDGYLFGLATEKKGAVQRLPLNAIAPLDAKGESSFNIQLKNAAATTRPQSAALIVRMREGSGRAVERRAAIDIIPQHTMIGVRPQFENGQVAENTLASFHIVAVDPGGKKTALPAAKWSLVKIERNYQWYRNSSSWRYEAIDLETKIADGTLDIEADPVAKLSVPVGWGRYRLDIESAAGGNPATSVSFYAGWYVVAGSTDTPDGLELALDKSTYKPGDTARLKVSPRFAGEMLIAIGTDRIQKTMAVTIPAEGKTVEIAVDRDWGAGAYVLATLYRPGNAGKSRMPMRSIGVKWLSVDPQNRALKVSLEAPAQTKPREKLSIPVSVAGLKPGEEAYVTVAAVDIGILNLTSYKSPNPVKNYFGQRKLGIAMRDIYGRLIDGSLGVTGKLRTGGDGGEQMNSEGSAPTEQLVAFFSGIVRLDDQGKTVIQFDIPQFNGSVRIMAAAWSADGVGSAQAETIIRAPVVITASLPKFMSPGDQARLLVEIANTDAPAGAYAIAFETSKNLILTTGQIAKSLNLSAAQKTSLNIPVTAKSPGKAWARILLSRADGFAVDHAITMNIRPALLPVTRKLQVSLAAHGGALIVDQNLFSDSNLNGATVNISVARPSPFDVPSLLMQLNRYPYGCTEQTTSKALPLLYVEDFSTKIPGLDTASVKDKIQKAINRVLSNQSNTGGFSLWGSGRTDLWLSAYVADFLTRAREKGYTVPEQPMKQALRSLQNMLAYQNNLKENDAAIAYAFYVLARNKMASAGDLRYYTDTQLHSFRTPIARAQLAAGMALYGDQQRAERTFRSAFSLAQQKAVVADAQYSFGSGLRDAAAMLALATETRPAPSNTAGMRQLAATIAQADRHTNTQEQAWMLLAARGEQASNAAISLNINGLPHSGAYTRAIDGAQLAANPIKIANRHGEDLQATLTTLAVPNEPLPPGGKGFSISRSYYRLDGTQANVGEVMQNERFVVVINLKQLRDVPSRIIVNDLLPAGFEIENPRLVQSADNDNFKWLPKSATAHLEFRDDRLIAAFNRSKGGKSEFVIAYTVRAVTPGTYVHPAAYVEDMYRPQLSARTATGWMKVNKPE